MILCYQIKIYAYFTLYLTDPLLQTLYNTRLIPYTYNYCPYFHDRSVHHSKFEFSTSTEPILFCFVLPLILE